MGRLVRHAELRIWELGVWAARNVSGYEDNRNALAAPSVTWVPDTLERARRGHRRRAGKAGQNRSGLDPRRSDRLASASEEVVGGLGDLVMVVLDGALLAVDQCGAVDLG